MILLDTDTVTQLSYGNDKVRQRIEQHSDETLAIAVITRYEILRGRAENLLKAANEGDLRTAAMRFRQAEVLVSDFEEADFNEDSIKHFERLRKQRNLPKGGRADILIACLALGHKALLVTRNTKDYKIVAGLNVAS